MALPLMSSPSISSDPVSDLFLGAVNNQRQLAFLPNPRLDELIPLPVIAHSHETFRTAISLAQFAVQKIEYQQVFLNFDSQEAAVCPRATLKHRYELRLPTVEVVHIQVAPVRCATCTVEQVDCCFLAAVPEEITIGDGNERKVGDSLARLGAI